MMMLVTDDVDISDLLPDHTTGKHITLSSNSYADIGYQPSDEITMDMLIRSDNILQPRHAKSMERQKARTKTKAEVFTPAWVCNKMINYADEDWFGRPDVFNAVSDDGRAWEPTTDIIVFGPDEQHSWKAYVETTRMEITCGEAPYITSRYDASTGDWIDLHNRIGMLDRKLRVVAENVNDDAEYIEWSIRALQSMYGYEYQGDNLLIGRINVLMTWMENVEVFCGRLPTQAEIKMAANIITWNLWQMDGIDNCVPETGETCLLMDWQEGASVRIDQIRGSEHVNEIRPSMRNRSRRSTTTR